MSAPTSTAGPKTDARATSPVSRRRTLLRRLVATVGLLCAAVWVQAAPPAKPGDPEWMSVVRYLLLTKMQDSCKPEEGARSISVPVWGTDEEGKPGLQSRDVGVCEPTPESLLDWLVASAVWSVQGAPPDGYVSPQSSTARNAFEALFGAPLVTRTVVDASGQRIALYHPAGLQAAWKALYVKPRAKLTNVVAGQIYAVTVQETVRQYATWMAKVLEHRDGLQRVTKVVFDKALSERAFDGATLVAEEVESSSLGVPPWFVHWMVRRTADGTLPVLTSALATLLQDYDPAWYAAVGGRLKAPAPPAIDWPKPAAALTGEDLQVSVLLELVETAHDAWEVESARRKGATLKLPNHQWSDTEHKWDMHEDEVGSSSNVDFYALAWSILGGIGMAAPQAVRYDAQSEQLSNAFDGSDDDALREAFQSVIGVPLIKETRRASGRKWLMFSPAAAEAAFKKLYIKPSHPSLGAPMQQIYTVVFRSSVREVADVIARLYSRRGQFDVECATYVELARRDADFDGGSAAYRAAVRLGGGTCIAGEACRGEPIADSGLVGTLMRRQIDGTLPVMARALKTVLADYDPEALAQYGRWLP
jgi:hypothetical protein